MLKRLIPLLFVVSVATVSATPTTACTSATLSGYESSFAFPSSQGCSIGILNYSNFSYHNISNAPSDASILLSPNGQGFSFSLANNQAFTATAGQTVSFEIDYNILIDPAPILTGADDSIDPPTGNVTITEFFCNDSQYFFSGTCFGGGVQSLTIGTVPPLQTSGSIVFNPPATSFEEVGILFTLTGPASFDALDATTIVVGAAPEPGSTLLVGFALIAGSYTLKKKRKR